MEFSMPADDSRGIRPPKILIADDQADVREALRLVLKNEGFDTTAAASPSGILKAVEDQDVDLVLMDLNYQRDTTSGLEGLEALTRLRALDSEIPVVVMTAWGSIDLAVEAMRRGAGDFVLKPWENGRLIDTVRTQSARRVERVTEARARAEAERAAAIDLDIARRIQSRLFPR